MVWELRWSGNLWTRYMGSCEHGTWGGDGCVVEVLVWSDFETSLTAAL